MTQKNQKPDDELDIEIELEGVEAPTPVAEAPAGRAAADEDDLSQYSAAVQKRIKKLVHERNEERRQREEAARLREEAIRYAETVARDNQTLKQQITVGQTSALNASKAQLEAELANHKAAFRAAYEAGDADKVTEAQVKIAELTAHKAQLEAMAARAPAQQPAQQQPQRPPTPRVPEPDPMAREWAGRNSWFGSNSEMTGYAYGVHDKLVRSGVDPRSKQYYDQLDEAIRRRFPEEFDTGEDVPVPPRKTGTVVAPVSRDAKAPRTVRLSPTAQALARRLGLTPEQYAAQVLKDQSNANG